MPGVLRQLTLIIAALAAVATLFASRAAGVRTVQIGLRTAAAFVVFLAGTDLLARALVNLMPAAWPGRRAPAAPPQVGQRVDITIPGTRPQGAFVPLSASELVGARTTSAGGGKDAGADANKARQRARQEE